MLSAKELENCIDLLADINVITNNNDIKRKLLEIGYTLKRELDNVSLIENMGREVDSRSIRMNNSDVKRLLEDNIQLFNEKEHALKQNQELCKVIDSKLKSYDAKIDIMRRSVDSIINGIAEIKGLV